MAASSQVGPATQNIPEGTHILLCSASANPAELSGLQQSLAAALPTALVSGAGSDAMLDSMLDTRRSSSGLADDLWPITSLDYISAFRLAAEQKATATLLLGPEASSLSSEALTALAVPVVQNTTDLTLSRPSLGPNDALISSALLYPITRSLFGVDAHLPMPPDVGFSLRLAERMASAAPRSSTHVPAFWPVAEAATASMRTTEVLVGTRTLPRPADRDVKSLLTEVLASLFGDLEAKAAFWQRARAVSTAPAASPESHGSTVENTSDEAAPMIESFRTAFDNLQEIWSLVLPPQSLLRIKRLARTPETEFSFAPDLWARTAFDFLLAFHQRTLNRGHLLGAFTPLYLAWVASHVRQSGGDAGRAADHVELCADAFVAEKPYLVSRWRWPDRFNP